MALGKNDSGQSLRLSCELRLTREVAGEEVLEDATMGSVGHDALVGGAIAQRWICLVKQFRSNDETNKMKNPIQIPKF